MKYRISWKALKTGASGHGKPIFNSYDQAQQTAEQLNQEYSGLVWHSIESVPEDQVENSPAEQQPAEPDVMKAAQE